MALVISASNFIERGIKNIEIHHSIEERCKGGTVTSTEDIPEDWNTAADSMSDPPQPEPIVSTSSSSSSTTTTTTKDTTAEFKTHFTKSYEGQNNPVTKRKGRGTIMIEIVVAEADEKQFDNFRKAVKANDNVIYLVKFQQILTHKGAKVEYTNKQKYDDVYAVWLKSFPDILETLPPKTLPPSAAPGQASNWNLADHFSGGSRR